MRNLFTCLLITFSILSCAAQTEAFTQRFYESYAEYQEASLDKRRIKHAQLQPLIDALASRPEFEVSTVGRSIEGRPLRLISLGTGEVDVFLWSQMHGNEPTATQAIFDILNFFIAAEFADEKAELLSKVKLHFLPMLNPDGAEVFQRRNTLGIDINRDALRLQSPEGQTLKKVRDSLDAEFGFNLHDQSTYYNAERTEKPATISYLAPAYNYEKDVNEVRANAMKVIGYMNRILQQYAPGQVGKYNDDFEPRAFGDNIQKWGTSAILIESGGYPNDIEKQEIRKLNYVSILSAIYAIASGSYNDVPLEDYLSIPENDRKLFDLKIEGISYPLLGQEYLMDFGIHRLEVDLPGHNDFWYSSRVIDMGDLSTYYGYEVIDGSGLRMEAGKVYEEVLEDASAAKALDFKALLAQGITYVRMRQIPASWLFSPYPVHILSESFELEEAKWDVGDNPTFVLYRGEQPEYAIINGFSFNLITGEGRAKNGMIFR